MIHFLSFASSNMAPTLHRIGKEARSSGFFDKVHLYTEKKLDWKFRRTHKKFFKEYPRGYGYWLWKPYLISKIMREEMNDGDVLVYLDAGCEVHTTGRKRWNEYLKMLEQYSVIVYRQGLNTERMYTKNDILSFFSVTNNYSLLDSRQLLAQIICRKDAFSTHLIDYWYEICERYKTTLLCDCPSVHKELDGFIENRHDQSLFSIICKIEDEKVISQDDGDHIKVLDVSEIWNPDWSKMSDYPFWAKRNKIFAQPSIVARVIRKLKSTKIIGS